MAVKQPKPEYVIPHSDQESQYKSRVLGQDCKEKFLPPSMGSVGECYDNVMCERFFATLECELFDRSSFKTKAETRDTCFEFIEGWYTHPDTIQFWDKSHQ